jgi:hypothetical protein
MIRQPYHMLGGGGTCKIHRLVRLVLKTAPNPASLSNPSVFHRLAKVDLPRADLCALPLIQGKRHHLKVVKGVIQFGTNRSRNDVITSNDFTGVWPLRDRWCISFSELNHTGFIYASEAL